MEPDKKKNIYAIANCGVEFVVAIVIGAIIGVWLDRYFDVYPVLTIIFFVFGSIAGYWNVLFYMKKQDTNDKNSK